MHPHPVRITTNGAKGLGKLFEDGDKIGQFIWLAQAEWNLTKTRDKAFIQIHNPPTKELYPNLMLLSRSGSRIDYAEMVQKHNESVVLVHRPFDVASHKLARAMNDLAGRCQDSESCNHFGFGIAGCEHSISPHAPITVGGDCMGPVFLETLNYKHSGLLDGLVGDRAIEFIHSLVEEWFPGET